MLQFYFTFRSFLPTLLDSRPGPVQDLPSKSLPYWKVSMGLLIKLLTNAKSSKSKPLEIGKSIVVVGGWYRYLFCCYGTYRAIVLFFFKPSYVAVTGLPQPQPTHALLMVKFARDILAKVPKVLKRLAPTLGPDTIGLAMRVGLHSGPVTTGVLRGEKARFQLFGDVSFIKLGLNALLRPLTNHPVPDLFRHVVFLLFESNRRLTLVRLHGR
jgi:Adenylate and Guanylate cyclase catalytic domain